MESLPQNDSKQAARLAYFSKNWQDIIEISSGSGCNSKSQFLLVYKL